MSTITKTWTEDKIRFIIRKLDEKTGLNGAALPIKLVSHGNALGFYQYAGEKQFGFKPKFINDPNTKEAAVIDVIRHEYAHYYVDVTGISRFFIREGSSKNHNTDWKWACRTVGANPNSYYQPQVFEDKDWSITDALSAYNADDVLKLNILEHISRWNRIPIDSETASKNLTRIKERNPEMFFEIGDEVLHPKRGFGTVCETKAFDYSMQRIYVRFEDQSDGVFDAKRSSG